MADVSLSFGGDAADARRAAEQIVRELEKISRQALQTGAVMRTALGGVSKDFNMTTSSVVNNRREIDENSKSVDRNSNAFSRLSKNIIVANQALSLFGKAISVLKIPALISAIGPAIQAINALVAGVVALGGALGSLAGLLGAAPGALLAVGGAAVTVKLAFKDLTEALGGNEEAFKRLTPEAKEFVSTLNGLKPVIKEIRREAQAGLFPGLTTALENIFSERNIGIFKRNIRAFGEEIGGVAAQFGKLFNQGDFARDLDFLLGSAAKNFGVVGGAAVKFADALRHIAVAAQPLVNWIAQLIGRFGQWAQHAAQAGRESGRLSRFFAETRQTLTELGRILGPLGRALLNIFKEAAPFGHQLLQMLGNVTEKFREWTDSASGQNKIRKYFADAMPGIIEMARLIRDVGKAFLSFGSGPAFAPLIRQIRQELLPLIVQLVQSAQAGFLPALINLVTSLVDFLTPMLGPSGPLTGFIKMLDQIVRFMDYLADTIPGVNHVLGVMFGILALNKILPITSAIWGLSKAILGIDAAAKVTIFSIKGLRAALVSTGIGAALVAIGLAAEYIITHWEEVKQWFTDFWNWLKEKAYDAALSILEPFSHLPGSMGQWARDAKDAVLLELNQLNTSATGAAAGEAWGRAFYGSVDKWVQDTGALIQGSGRGKVLVSGQSTASGNLPPRFKTGTGDLVFNTSLFQEQTSHPRDKLALDAEAADLAMGQAGMYISAPEDGNITRHSGNDPRKGTVGAGGDVFGWSLYFTGTSGTLYYFTHLDLRGRLGYYTAGSIIGRIGVWPGDPGRSHVHMERKRVQGTFTPTPLGGTTPGFTPSTPTFDTAAEGTKRAPKAEVADFTKELSEEILPRRILAPQVRAQVQRQLAEIRKLLTGVVTNDDLTKAKEKFDDLKEVYQRGLDLNPLIRRFRYIQGHLGQIAHFPEVQKQVREGMAKVRQLLKDGVTEREAQQIERIMGRVRASFQKGLQLESLRRQWAQFTASMKNVVQDAIKSLQPVTEASLRAQLERIGEQYADAISKGLVKKAAALLAQAREVRQQLVNVLAEGISSARQRVSSAIGSIMDAALSEFDRKTELLVAAARRAVDSAFGVIRGETAASRRLRQFREARDAEAFAKSVSDAQKELAEAELALQKARQGGTTPEEIKEAEERVLAARETLRQLDLDAQERALSKEAEAQEQAYQEALQAAEEQTRKEREALRTKLEERLRMIQAAYEEERITAEEAQIQILELLGTYGIETTEAMGATYVFTKALEELGKAIGALANALVRAANAAGVGGGGGYSGGGVSNTGGGRESGGGTIAEIIRGVVGRPHMQHGGFVPYRAGIGRWGRDSVPVMLTPGELVLNAAQQERVASRLGWGGGGSGTTIVVTLPNATLLGRSLQVADEIADAVSPAIARRVGYRDVGR